MKTIRVFAVVLIAADACLLGSGGDSPAAADKLPEMKELPNPFAFSDGMPVRSKEDWKRRREEIKRLFEDYEYGHLPPKPEKLTISRGDVVADEERGVSTQSLELNLEHGGKTLLMHVRLTLPRNPAGSVPVVVQGAFGRITGAAAGAAGSGRPAQPNPRLSAFTKRGYAVAEFDFQEVAIDNKDRGRTAGVYQLFGDKIDCGGLMAWAWGFHRAIDAIETVDRIDARKVVVTGHSRFGKAALLAGAFDDRIALTVPSHSGCAGAAPYRFIYGKSEQLQNIAGFAPHWFRPDFNRFVGNVGRLPVDQHLLMSLIAPRALLTAEGTEDSWTNPQGAQLTFVAAKKVYDFLDAGGQIGIRFRPVGHIPNSDDLLDFADRIFFKKPLSEEFGKLPYPEEKSGFNWDAPK